MRRLLLVMLAASLTFQVPVSAQAPAQSQTQADLATGIRQVEEGDLEAAVITLDAVVQRLKQAKGQERDLATAHLYLSMAHLGLSQSERAKGEMREAWRANRELTLDPKRFPPKVIQLYEQTKKEGWLGEAAPSPAPVVAASPQASPKPTPAAPGAAAEAAPAKKGGSKALWIGLGLAAVGGGVAAAAGGGGGDGGPSPSPTAPPPSGSVTADLKLNGQDSGTFSCRGGLFFAVSVSNTTAQSVRVDRFDLTFSALSSSCRSHVPAGLDGSALDAREVPSGATLQVRRVDLAGSVCDPPNGAAGCEWNAVLVVTTSAGMPRDELRFTTSN